MNGKLMKLMMMMMMMMMMTMMMMKGETLATDSPRWPTARLFPAGAIQLSSYPEHNLVGIVVIIVVPAQKRLCKAVKDEVTARIQRLMPRTTVKTLVIKRRGFEQKCAGHLTLCFLCNE